MKRLLAVMVFVTAGIIAVSGCANIMPRYEGDYIDGKRHGHGTMVWPDGKRYEGDWVNGKEHGHGTYVWPGGHRYEGDFVDGEKHGYGIYKWPNGTRYDGGWVDGIEHGRGTWIWPSGKRYRGDIVTNKMTGHGIMIWPGGHRYEGDFVDNKITGRGKMTKLNGDWYDGEWHDGYPDGKGQAEINGKMYKGVWARGCLRSGDQQVAWEVPFKITACAPMVEHRSRGEPAEATGIPVSEMDYVMKFRGFSIQKPTDDRWQLHSDNQKPHIASFYFVPLSPTHSFNATVQIRGLPADFATKQEFKEFVDTKLREHGSRFEELSFISTLTELSGEWAVTYELRYLDKNPVNSSTPLFMTIKGFMYLHPYWKKRVIDAFYSERGTEAELDGTLDPVGQELIDGTSPEKS